MKSSCICPSRTVHIYMIRNPCICSISSYYPVISIIVSIPFVKRNIWRQIWFWCYLFNLCICYYPCPIFFRKVCVFHSIFKFIIYYFVVLNKIYPFWIFTSYPLIKAQCCFFLCWHFLPPIPYISLSLPMSDLNCPKRPMSCYICQTHPKSCSYI